MQWDLQGILPPVDLRRIPTPVPHQNTAEFAGGELLAVLDCRIDRLKRDHAPQSFSLSHRARAPLRAISLRCSTVIVFSRALPPRRPNFTASGFFRFLGMHLSRIYGKRLGRLLAICNRYY